MEQLTIFDAMAQFDENLANWEDVMGQFEKCTVSAFIPADALSSLEQWNIRLDASEKKRRHKLWGEYTTAIWHHIGFVEDSWEIACRKLEKYRDANKPCPMNIYRYSHSLKETDFRPERVVDYL